MAARYAEVVPLRELAAVALADNAELKARVARIVDLMLDDVERTFRIGDAKDKAIYARQIVPTLLRSMSEADAAGGDVEMRASFERVP